MPHKRRGGRRPIDRYHGMAVASACDDCAHLIGNPGPSEHGTRMRLVHTSDIPGLVALGWIRTDYPHEPPDVTCVHYHRANWEGGHDGCCGMDG